ncbi:MAG: ribonuclease R [Eubacteriales bacterium]
MDENIRKEISEYVNSPDYVAITPKKLAAILGYKDGEGEFFDTLADMSEKYEICITGGGKVVLPSSLGILTGTFSSSARGEYGFVTSGGKEYFVPPRFTAGAKNGDTVAIKKIDIRSKYAGKGNEAEVVGIIKHANETVIGTFKILPRGGRYISGAVTPDDARLRFTVYINRKYFGGAKDGDKVVCLVTSFPEYEDEEASGKITEVLGKADSQEANYKAILIKNGITTEFSDKALSEAEEASKEKIKIAGRVDLRKENIFTIDGADAKDLDDAISLKKTKNGYVLGVHIADVSHYVKENTVLDSEAMARGTSVYFTDKVVPMLPVALSNGICSLNAGVNRYALSAIMTLDRYGNIEKTEIKRSVICSKVRGVYSELNDIIEKGEKSEFYKKYEHVYDDFSKMLELYNILKTKSRRKGAIELEGEESKIILDETGHPTDIVKRERGESEKLIEQFMLCANEAVATYLNTLKLPCVYRVHEEPDPEKINSFAVFASNLGVDTSPLHTKGPVTPAALSAVLESARREDCFDIVSSVLLRSLMKARYSSVQKSHFGLATELYCHFTSPIRRYPDLTVHRIINALIDGKDLSQYAEFASDSARESSENELKAINAEREIEDLYKCVYLGDRIGEEYDAVICSVTSFGFFARTKNLCEGLVKIESLNGNFSFDERNYSLTAGKKSYRLGDEVRVKVESVDIISGKAIFTLCGKESADARLYKYNDGKKPKKRVNRKPQGRRKTSYGRRRR